MVMEVGESLGYNTETQANNKKVLRQHKPAVVYYLFHRVCLA